MNQTAQFEEAVATMNNLRAAAKAGDEIAIHLVALADANQPAFALADLSAYRPKRERR